MRTWIAVYLPLLRLEALRPCWSEPGEFAVVDEDRVVALSAGAAAGITLGMRRGGVATVAPDVTMLERQQGKEDVGRDAILLALLQFTPEIAQVDNAGMLLDVTASLRLFGGHVALCRRVKALIARLGFTVTLGTGPTALGAWLLATAPSPRGRMRRRRTIKPASLKRSLDRLPCFLLDSAQPHAEWLENIGCTTLGKLRALPRAGLLRRTSEHLVAELDRAYGALPELFEWVIPPPTFLARTDLMERIEHADGLLADANRLVLQLIGWLAALKLAVSRIVLGMEHERGRQAVSPTELEVALAEPTWCEDHLMRLLKEKFSRTELPAPVIAIYLKAIQFVEMAPVSDSLFPEPGGTPGDFARLLELLVARLGKDNVLSHVRLAEHRPGAVNCWLPATDKRPKPDQLQESAPRPFWLLPTPIRLITRDNRPFYESPLRIVDGPERIESGWWDGAIEVRDYYVAQGANGRCFWLFQQRDDDPTWHLHGLFG